jgi:hypothetical protein
MWGLPTISPKKTGPFEQKFDFLWINLYNNPAESELTEMNLRRFLLLGNILLSCLIVWAGVSVVVTWASDRRAGDSPLSVQAKASIPKDLTSSKGKRLDDYVLITTKDVFHTTKEIAKRAGKGQAEEFKVKELNVELKGTGKIE